MSLSAHWHSMTRHLVVLCGSSAMIAAGVAGPPPSAEAVASSPNTWPSSATARQDEAPAFVQVAAGQGFTLGLTSSGQVYSWGSNELGQLGLAGTGYEPDPTAIPSLDGVVQVAAGDVHALALTDDGDVYSWGFNGRGQLGTGDKVLRRTPVRVDGLSDVAQVEAGIDESWAVRSDGSVYVWGEEVTAWNETVESDCGGSERGPKTVSHLVPTPVQDLSGVKAIEANQGFVHFREGFRFALMTNGTVKSWGNGTSGRLGLGDCLSRERPTKIPGLVNIVEITTGPETAFAVDASGAVFGWGHNWQQGYGGQLGTGSSDFGVFSPEPVQGLPPIADVAAGPGDALAVDEEGRVWAWGTSKFGQYPTGPGGTLEPSPGAVPVVLQHPQAFHQVAGGRGHSLALTSSGGVLPLGAAYWQGFPIRSGTNPGLPAINIREVDVHWDAIYLYSQFGYELDGQDSSVGQDNSIVWPVQVVLKTNLGKVLLRSKRVFVGGWSLDGDGGHRRGRTCGVIGGHRPKSATLFITVGTGDYQATAQKTVRIDRSRC